MRENLSYPFKKSVVPQKSHSTKMVFDPNSPMLGTRVLEADIGCMLSLVI